MHGAVQIGVKIFLIAATLLVAVIVCARVWKSDLDIRQLLSPRQMVRRAVDAQIDWLPTRELDALYQDGRVVGRVIGSQYDDKKAQLYIEEIYNSGTADLNLEFEYQKWRLKFLNAQTLIGMLSSAPEKGRIIREAAFEVLGERSL